VEQPDLVARDEAMRVLCPKGILALREPGGGWVVEVKPWPDGMDSWTHFLHGPDNNAVAQDRQVGPPRQLQWSGGLALSRDHVFTPSLTSLVSGAGRLFAIMDYGPTVSSALPYDWHLVARDAFSGVELWRVAVGRKWATHGFRGGPAFLARRLVAAGGRVYVTLWDDAPVSQLNAATGEVLRTFSGTEGTQEILVDDRLLAIRRDNAVMMLDTESGETIWEKQIAAASMSLTMRSREGMR
jgi:outer membrane protein assembly factor BamB